MRRALICAGIAVLLSGCSGPRGPMRHSGYFPLVTSRSLPSFAEVGSQVRVTAQECYGASVFLGAGNSVLQDAVDKAIAQRPGANALLYARAEDHGRCLVVEGWPVRHDPASPSTQEPANP